MLNLLCLFITHCTVNVLKFQTMKCSPIIPKITFPFFRIQGREQMQKGGNFSLLPLNSGKFPLFH